MIQSKATNFYNSESGAFLFKKERLMLGIIAVSQVVT